MKVLDFGLAKAFQPDASDPNVSASPTISLTAAATQMGMVIGTAAYMAPEQASGKAVDKRADVWAFGVVLYEMLTGTRPFVGDDVSKTLARVIATEPDWSLLSDDVPPLMGTFLRGCLAKDPTQRVRDIGDVRLALTGTLDIEVTPPPSPTAAPGVRWWQRPVPLADVAAVIMVAASLAGWSLRSAEPGPVSRFSYDLPANHQLRRTTRRVLAVSPDGRRFAYNTTQGVFLRSMDALESQLLPGTEGVLESPVFSADGQSPAYATIPDGQLWRLALSGGAPVVLGEGRRPFGLTWEADGTILLADDEGILRVSANGGALELVVPAEEGERLDSPRLLPDWDSILFTVGGSGTGGGGRSRDAQIAVHSLATGIRTVLMPGEDASYVSTGHLVYALDEGLFAVAFDADTLTVLGGAVSLVQGVVRATYAASANYANSDDGTLFYLAGTAASSSTLAWVDRTGTVDVIGTVPSNEYTTPRLSPDGERLLVVAEGDVWTYDLASGRGNPVTTDGRVIIYADWAPSGTAVAYSSGRGGGIGEQIWSQPADGSGAPRQLTSDDGGAIHLESWSPDGRMVAGHQHPGSGLTNLLMIPVDGTDTEPVIWLERQFEDASAVFSPDGRYVAHVSDQSGVREIYVRPFPGPGGQETVSVGGGDEPAWASNGELFYRRPSDYAMMVVEVSTDPTLTIGSPQELFRGGVYPGGSPRAKYAVTADGQRFLMSANLTSSPEQGTGPRARVVVVQNWLEELKARVPTN